MDRICCFLEAFVWSHQLVSIRVQYVQCPYRITLYDFYRIIYVV
jgi:hypothetical protein